MKTAGFNLPSWPARHARPAVLLGLTAVAYLAAINRAQPLPWAIAALLSATLVTGVAWPHWLVKRLSVVRRGPERAAEGETVTFHAEVENLGWLPRFMVELVDHLPFVGAAEGRADQGERTLGVVAYVPARGRRRFAVLLLCEKRGYYRLGPVGLASSFPLGLAEARQRRNDGVQTLTIYPSVFPIMALPLHGAPSQIHRGAYLLPEGAGAAEFSGLREYQRGDNPRHVHWPTTARTGELMVKEFEPLASACMYLVLDQAAASNIGQGREATFEYGVRIAASMAGYATGNGIPTRLLGRGERPLYLSPGVGERHDMALLDALAVVAADGAVPYGKVLEQAAADCCRGETVVVFLSGPVAEQEATLNALALLRMQGANLFAVVFERESFRRHGAGRDPVAARYLAGLLELGAHCVPVRQGDDLVRLFNR